MEFTRSDHEGDDQSRLSYPSWVYNNNHKMKGPSLVAEEKVTMRMGRLSSSLDMQNGDSTWHMEVYAAANDVLLHCRGCYWQ